MDKLHEASRKQFEEWFRSKHEGKMITKGMGYSEPLTQLMWQHIHELDAANSPEIPDGWVSCSEHMPVDCQTVLCSNLLTELSGIPFIADYVGMFELYDGTKYESGFYVNRELQTVTHWMPLPAAPKPEK